MSNKNDYFYYLETLEKRFENYDFETISEILNNSIYYISHNDGYKGTSKYSLKMVMAFSFITFANCMKHRSYKSINDIQSLKILMTAFYNRELKLKSHLEKSLKYNDSEYAVVYNRNYFDFNLESTGEMIKFFRKHDDLFKEVYGFPFYGKILEFILAITDAIKFDDKNIGKGIPYYLPMEVNKLCPNPSNRNKLIDSMYASTYFKFVDSESFLRILALRVFDISYAEFNQIKDKLFLNISEEKDLNNFINIYPDKVYQKIKGYIGIRYKDMYFIPKNYYIISSLINNIVSIYNVKNKYGHIFENSIMDLFKSLLINKNYVYHSRYYLDNNNKQEQDLIIEFDNNVFIVECKSNNFKGVNKDFYKERTDSIIGKGIKQANRVEENIKFNNGKFISSGGKIFQINNENNIYKIVVTAEDFSKMSIDPVHYLDIDPKMMNNTWVVNYHVLSNIIFHCKEYGVEILLNYINKRPDIIDIFQSFHELDYFSAFVNENKILKNVDKKEFSKVLIPDISNKMLEDYDKASDSEIDMLKDYIEKEKSVK